jgi:molybdopterin-guanine dinucleotide biosynthesis protein A
MGSEKALIRFAGEPLVQHALAILGSAGLKVRIAGAQAELSSFAPVVEDQAGYSGQGPLSGICSGLHSINCRYAIFLPVDLPLIPSGLIAYLLHHAIVTESAVTVISVASFVETFPAVIDRAAVPSLEASLRSDDRKTLTAFRAAADALGRPCTVLPLELLVQAGQVAHTNGIPASSWFLNINTPEDLEHAEHLLAAGNRVI